MKPAKETEVKVRIPHSRLQEMRDRLGELGFQRKARRARETNLLFDDPSGKLTASGAALRLREYGSERLLTFKGPRTADPGFKIRDEIETTVGDFLAARRLLEAAGMRVCFEYGKYREKFSLRLDQSSVEVCVDETPVGCFVEIEGSKYSIQHIAQEMGLSRDQFINKDYVELYQQGEP